MFTVTHYGLSKDFASIYAAMRYAMKRWQYSPVIWSSERPLWQASQWIEKKQDIQAKKMHW
jgi:hypothetical protein